MALHSCIGVDPNPNYFKGFLKQEFVTLGAKKFLIQFSKSIIDAAKKTSSKIKFQSAFFERFGAHGFEALEVASKYANQEGVFTILDAKRSDIGSTMDAYLDSAFKVLNVDAMTVVPWMGLDYFINVMPMYPEKQIIIVGLSSNLDAAPIQLAKVDDRPALDHIVDTIYCSDISEQVGYVIGLTSLDKLDKIQLDLLKGTRILMPGVGFQGGKISKKLLEFSQHADIMLSASRSLTLVGVEDAEIGDWSAYSAWVTQNTISGLKGTG